MRTARAILAAVAVSAAMVTAHAAPVYVYDGGLGTWSDVNKASVAGAPDSLFCWAAAASNNLAWTKWWGWDTATSSYLDTASKIYAVFDAGWSNRTGSTFYAYEWWMTNRANSFLNAAFVFDSPSKNFYPGVVVEPGPANVVGFVPEANHAAARDAVNDYVNADRGIAITIEVERPGGGGTYGHALTVWGFDAATNDIYLTDSDDGATELDKYRIYQAADTYWYIEDYTNLYTAAIDARITEVFRLNRNDPFSEPNQGAPEPSTILLLAASLASMGLLRRKH